MICGLDLSRRNCHLLEIFSAKPATFSSSCILKVNRDPQISLDGTSLSPLKRSLNFRDIEVKMGIVVKFVAHPPCAPLLALARSVIVVKILPYRNLKREGRIFSKIPSCSTPGPHPHPNPIPQSNCSSEKMYNLS